MNAEKEKGIVKFFDGKKGFGFIIPDNGGNDLFVHYSRIKAQGFRKLDENQIVYFNREMGPKGKEQACNVSF